MSFHSSQYKKIISLVLTQLCRHHWRPEYLAMLLWLPYIAGFVKFPQQIVKNFWILRNQSDKLAMEYHIGIYWLTLLCPGWFPMWHQPDREASANICLINDHWQYQTKRANIIIIRAKLRQAAGESDAVNRVRFLYICRALGHLS